MTFGYDSGVLFSSSKMRLGDFSRDLLARLHLVRKDPLERKRPLLFICHSLGGVVAKQVLVLANAEKESRDGLLPSIAGIAFFGTPHRGSRSAGSGVAISRILNALSFGTTMRSDLIRALEVSSQELEVISMLSVNILFELPIVSFYEQKPLGRSLVRFLSAASFFPSLLPRQ